MEKEVFIIALLLSILLCTAGLVGPILVFLVIPVKEIWDLGYIIAHFSFSDPNLKPEQSKSILL